MNNLEVEIQDGVTKDKINKFYNKNKALIISALLLIFLVPILFQVYFFYDYKKKENLFSEYLRAEMLINTNSKEAISILNQLQKTDVEIVSLLSTNRLLDYYIDNNKLKEASNLINDVDINIEENYIKELYNIKKIIINFETIKENQISEYLRSSDEEIFKLIKNKLLYDYYIKNNQIQKASQIKNIN